MTPTDSVQEGNFDLIPRETHRAFLDHSSPGLEISIFRSDTIRENSSNDLLFVCSCSRTKKIKILTDKHKNLRIV